MGLFDKLFGGKRPDAESSPESPAAPATPAPPAAGAEANPPRRERSKPAPAAAAAETPAVDPRGMGAESIMPESDAQPLDLAPDNDENAELIAAINGIVASDDEQSRTRLYQSMLATQLYLVSMNSDDIGTGEVTLQEGQQLQLATMRSPEGQVFLPAFTDLVRLERSLPEKARYIRLPVPAICAMFVNGGGDGILINPGQPPSGIITRPEAEILAQRQVPQVDPSNGQQVRTQTESTEAVPQQMRIVIGKPDEPPSEPFVAAIRGAAREQAIVREVHVFNAGIEDQPMRLMVGVLIDDNLTPEQMHPAFEAIGKAAYDVRGEMEAFDMMPLNEQMIEAVRPLEGQVYVRSAVV